MKETEKVATNEETLPNLNKIDRHVGIHYIGGEHLPAPLDPIREAEEIAKLETEFAEEAKAILVKYNLRLVVYVVKKFDNTGFGVEDLISAGTVGLIKAINTYSREKNIKLATYASRCIENEILMYIRRNNKTKLELPIDEPLKVSWDGNELLLSEILGVKEGAIYKKIEEVDRKSLSKALVKLSERERLIVVLRFGLNPHDRKERTQKEVANLLGISESYISRLEEKIIKRLKKELERQS